MTAALHGESLDLVPESADLGVQVGGFVGGDRHGDDGARNTGGAAEGDLGGNVDVGGTLIFTQQGDVKHDAQWLSIRGKDNELRSSTAHP